jgi:hypothetical protein
MTTATKPQTMTLFVVPLMFDGTTINLPALFELRAAGWTVEIEHSGAFSEQEWGGMDPQVWFYARKLFPDDSPGTHADEGLMSAVFKEITAVAEKWDAFTDGLSAFKNPKPMAWQYHPFRDGYGPKGDEWDEAYERS